MEAKPAINTPTAITTLEIKSTLVNACMDSTEMVMKIVTLLVLQACNTL